MGAPAKKSWWSIIIDKRMTVKTEGKEEDNDGALGEKVKISKIF